MKKIWLLGAWMACTFVWGFAQPRELKLRTDVPLDSNAKGNYR